MARTSTRVGPAGGRVEHGNGRVGLEVPPGAFAHEADVEVEELARPAEAVNVGTHRLAGARHVRLEARLSDRRPHPMPFAKPVRLRVRLSYLDLRGSTGAGIAIY